MTRRRRWTRRGASVAAGLSATLAVLSVWGVGRAAARAETGAATIAHPDDGAPTAGTPLLGGRADTPFTLRLPPGAGCRGDSADDGWRVQSFLVPATVDPATLRFDHVGPAPTGTGERLRQPLFQVLGGRPYVDVQTAEAEEDGGPGLILSVPAFDLSPLPAGAVVPGDHLVGLACTSGPASADQVDRTWTARLKLAGDGAWTTSPPAAPAAPAPATRVVAVDGSGHAALPVDAADAVATGDAVLVATSSAPRSSAAPAPGGSPTAAFLPALVPGAGSSSAAAAVWVVVFVASARMVLLLSRPVRVIPAG